MWNDLTMSERADVIKMAVKAGLRDMKSIRDFYDKSLSGNSYKYEEGGPKATLVDSDKIRMSPSGTFSDDNGNIIGDSVILPELTVRAHKGYKSAYDKDPINVGKITKGIGNLAAYTKAYLNSKFRPSEGEIIDLSDKEVARIKSNTDDVSSILTNDFVESKNSNLIRKKEDFINTKDTLLGDRKIPLSKISTFYGIENGKLKVGPLSIFNDTTTVVPNRAKYIGKIREYHPNTSKVDKDEYLDSLEAAVRRYNIEHNYKPKGLEKILLPIIKDNPQYTLYQNVGDDSRAIIHKLAEPYRHLMDKSNNSYAITESGDTIRPYNINATPKTLFADENGNAIFTSLSESNVDELNKRLNKTPMYPIMVDNGRYAFYQTESPNVGAYSGLNNPNEMFILGTVTKEKNKRKVK